MQEITKNIDADTFRVAEEDTLDTSHRVLGINTDESVAVNAGRNTESGAEASKRAKTILPKGEDVRTEEHGKGVFGRTLSDVKIVTKGGEVDYGFVTLNEGMSKYSVDHGVHPNPEQHEQFQEYYSDVAPYQYANGKKPLTQERYAEVASNIAAYTEAEKAYTDGDISREKYEEAMYNAYGKEHAPDVAAYRHMNMNWQRDMDMAEYDKSDKMAYLWSAQSQENRDIYDKAVRNTHTGGRSIPEKKQSFWQSMAKDTETMFSALNDIAVIGRAQDLTNARIYGDDETEIADEELVRGLPVEWHDKVMQEAEQYGDDAALQYRDNVTTSLTNAQAMSEMSLVTQIATAIPAVLLSPSTLIPGLAIGKGTVTAGRSIDMILKVGRAKNLAIPTKVAMWAAAGTAEAGIAGVARFATDDTFTSKDMLNEMKYGALFGAAVPAVIAGSAAGIRRVSDYQSGMDKVIKGMRADTEAMVETPFKRPENKVRTQGGVEPYNAITGSQYLADKEAAQAMKTPRSATVAKVDHVAGEVPKPMKVLTEDDLNYLDNAAEGIPQNPKPAEEIKAIKDAHDASRRELEVQAFNRMATLLDSDAPAPHVKGKASATVDAATGSFTRSYTQRLLESDSKVSRFMGTLLELPEGQGGKVIREPTAALQQHSLRTRYLTQTIQIGRAHV